MRNCCTRIVAVVQKYTFCTKYVNKYSKAEKVRYSYFFQYISEIETNQNSKSKAKNRLVAYLVSLVKINVSTCFKK